MRQLTIYADKTGKEPYQEWFDSLSEEYQGAVDKYLSRVAQGGSKKNVEPVGCGVYEVKINYGPGLRVYFGEDGLQLIILLGGGDKSTQSKDIHNAISYWSDYEKTKKL